MIREEFLHYLWKIKGFDTSQLICVAGEQITIINFGQHNYQAGPDFFNVRILINDQQWAGTIEMHVKSADWYVHGHELDEAYDNVILHVVWENDIPIYRQDNSLIPTLILKDYVDLALLGNYKKLFSSKIKWINCENNLSTVNHEIVNLWLERLYIERLSLKSNSIETILEQTNNDWEATLFYLLATNFGLLVNKEAFASLANRVPYHLIRKVQHEQFDLEALLFGQAGMLKQEVQDTYYLRLQGSFAYLVKKYKIVIEPIIPFQYFRLRPINFPTIRIAQLAALYAKEHHLFSRILAAKNNNDYYELFTIKITEYWKSHYTFTSLSKRSAKKLSCKFIDLLLINTILPIKFHYLKSRDQLDLNQLFTTIRHIDAEKNNVIKKFEQLGIKANNALESQALIQLKNHYCKPNNCLQCSIGSMLIKTVNRGKKRI